MSEQGETDRGRKPTVEEAEAILTLVRGGWLRLELALDQPATPDACICEPVDAVPGEHRGGITRDKDCPQHGDWLFT